MVSWNVYYYYHYFTKRTLLFSIGTLLDKMFLRKVGPSHHGKPRPQVAGGGTASNTEGSRECIE